MRGQSSSVECSVEFCFIRWMRVRVDNIDDFGGEKCATMAIFGKCPGS